MDQRPRRPLVRGRLDLVHLEVLERVDLHDQLAVVGAVLPVDAVELGIVQQPVGLEREARGEAADAEHQPRDRYRGEAEEDAAEKNRKPFSFRGLRGGGEAGSAYLE